MIHTLNWRQLLIWDNGQDIQTAVVSGEQHLLILLQSSDVPASNTCKFKLLEHNVSFIQYPAVIG